MTGAFQLFILFTAVSLTKRQALRQLGLCLVRVVLTVSKLCLISICYMNETRTSCPNE
jgi:hypothetical protein